MLPAAFNAFLEQTPVCVMARATLECLFSPERLDALFRDKAKRQYERELLFSQIVELMMSVVLRIDPSVNAAYKKRAALLRVSDQAIYDKLRLMELGISASLVADSAEQLGPVIGALKARQPPWVPGYRTRIVDGNHLSATERRLRVLRRSWAAALPGKVLAVYEQELDLVTEVFLTPDGHAQERSLFSDVLSSVRSKDLWIADRNFCTLAFLSGIGAAEACFVIRQHGTLKGHLLGNRRECGQSSTGRIYEQDLELTHDGQVFCVRRVTVELDKPTRDADTELHVLTNLPADNADASQVADLYRKRWTIEKRFYDVTQTLDCEPNTLGYPKAALFAFCLALVASNAVALMQAGLRSIHGAQAVAEMSKYYITLEVSQTYRGMMVALPPDQWSGFHNAKAKDLAKVLRSIAQHVNLTNYKKAHRGPKKPPPRRGKYKNGGHVSTHRQLEKEQP
jgi:hypothetical protein